MTGLFPDRSPSPEAALRDLKDGRPSARQAAAETLGDVRDPEMAPRARAALIRATDDLRPEVRATAALALGDIGGEEVAAALIRCLDDGNSEVRQSAAVALGSLGDKSAVSALIGALRDGPPDLRFQAATSLAELDPSSAREPLLAALEDDDAEVIAAAALALGAIGEQRARDRLAELIPKHGPKTAFDLAYALADLGDVRAADTLGQYMADDSFGWDAIVSLEKLAETEAGRDHAERHLTELLQRKNLSPPLGLRAAAVLLRHGSSAASATHGRRTLLEGLRARKLEHRGLSIELLAEVGGPWAREPLERLRGRWSSRRLHDEIDDALAALSDRTEAPQ